MNGTCDGCVYLCHNFCHYIHEPKKGDWQDCERYWRAPDMPRADPPAPPATDSTARGEPWPEQSTAAIIERAMARHKGALDKLANDDVDEASMAAFKTRFYNDIHKPPVTAGGTDAKWLCPDCVHADICRILQAASGEGRAQCGYYAPKSPITEWHKGSEKPKNEQCVLAYWENGDPGTAEAVYWDSKRCVWYSAFEDVQLGVPPDYWARIDWEGRHNLD